MDLLTPSIGLLFWQLVVFALLVVLLAKVAWKPILAALKEREDTIQQSLDLAEQAKREVSALKAENEKRIDETREESARIIREAREVAARIQLVADEESRRQAERLMSEARAAVQSEKRVALGEMRTQVAMLSLEIAEKLIKEKIQQDNGSQQQLIERYLSELKTN